MSKMSKHERAIRESGSRSLGQVIHGSLMAQRRPLQSKLDDAALRETSKSCYRAPHDAEEDGSTPAAEEDKGPSNPARGHRVTR